jgi:hypothetical protein
MFLFMVLFLSTATCAAVRNTSSIGVDVSGVNGIAQWLGLADAERVRDGHDDPFHGNLGFAPFIRRPIELCGAGPRGGNCW